MLSALYEKVFGGRITALMRYADMPSGPAAFKGCYRVYREITPPERLVFVSMFSDEKGAVTRHPMAPSWPLEMPSTFSFAEVGGATTFTLTWMPLNPTPEECATFENGHESMRQGWAGTFEQFAAYLARA